MAQKRKPKSEFGKQLTELIKAAEMSQYDFYSEAKIAKPYFYDIISGRTSPPPRETLERMMDVLEKRLPPDKKRRTDFINCAAIYRDEIPCDISDMIRQHPECWDALRNTLQTLIVENK
jgi:predicted transcriptional regulator